MKIISFHKKRHMNPHAVWALYCSVFIVGLIVLLGASSWYFIHTTEHIDSPSTAVLETNAGKIQAMQQSVDQIEKAVGSRKKI